MLDAQRCCDDIFDDNGGVRGECGERCLRGAGADATCDFDSAS